MSFNFLEVILIVFFTALIVSVLFRQLNLSVVLGYLLVGAIVGPHALALVPDSDYLDKLAEFGIVFLMFTVGLEFSIPKLFALRKAVFVIGGFQVFFCVLISTFIGVLLGMETLAALVVGSIVAMSSTALVVKQLNEKLELHTRYGLNAVGILLFQDLAVIPLIILIAGLAKSSGQHLGIILLWSLFKGVLAISLIFILGRWLLKPLFHFISKARAIELFTLSALLVTLSAAWITHIMGLSYALGAFLAGIMLAETEFRHQIEVEIRPFRDVLLALFFITIGMLTDVSTWDDTWIWIFLLFIALVVGKMLLIAILARLSGYYYSTAIRTGIVLAQGGEFGFAILTLAINEHMIPVEYEQVILAALLLSIAVAPILINFNKQIANIFSPKIKEKVDTNKQLKIIEHAKKLDNHVIICGYGRVGQHICRLLDRINFPYIAIDTDAELVQKASLAGENVMYGDAPNPEILEIAGIQHAKVLIICMSDYRAATKVLGIVRQRHPQLPILVRCRDKAELMQLKKSGATFIIAEIFEASLSLLTHLLQILSLPRRKAFELIQEVRSSDYELLHKVFPGSPEIESDEHHEATEQMTPIVISSDAYAADRTLSELNLDELNIEVMSIRRGNEKYIKPHGNVKIQANDIIVLFGELHNLELAEDRLLGGD
jgi:CPA2 family monovalent cation:H+ antiporter-2